MQNVSDAVRALVDRYARIKLAVYIDGSKVEAGVASFELSVSCGDDEAFSFGNACAGSVNISLDAAMPDIKGHKLQLAWSVDDTEYPLFDGTVEDPLISAGRTEIEAWDAMYYGGSNLFIPTGRLVQDVDAADAFSEIASAIGVSPAADALDMLRGIIIPGGLLHLQDDTSNSAVAGFIAGLIGGNAMIDRAGQLTVRQICMTDFETEPYAGGAVTQGKNYRVSGITLQREEVVSVENEDGTSVEQAQLSEYFAGDGTLMVNNPLADQAAADRVFDNLKDLSFRPGSYSFPGGLLLEPGDGITVHTMDGSHTVVCAMLSMSFDGGVKTSASCGGYPTEGGSQGAINQALTALQADFARFRTLVAENARIVSARISNLTADDITAGRIHSTDFAVVELEEIYPAANLFPQQTLYPNNGEQILRGFEIDFESGIIRGVFWGDAIEAQENRLLDLEAKQAELEQDLAEAEKEIGVLSDQIEEIQSENQAIINRLDEIERSLASS